MKRDFLSFVIGAIVSLMFVGIAVRVSDLRAPALPTTAVASDDVCLLCGGSARSLAFIMMCPGGKSYRLCLSCARKIVDSAEAADRREPPDDGSAFSFSAVGLMVTCGATDRRHP